MFNKYIKDIVKYSREILFKENNNNLPVEDLEIIEKSLNIKLPNIYKQFYCKFAPFILKEGFIILPEFENEVALCSLEIDSAVFFAFGRFLNITELIQSNNGIVKELNNIHKWDLIMIARGDTDPYSHVFLGIGEQNKDKIYYVNTQQLPNDEEINTSLILPSNGHFIKYISKDVFQFLKTLNFVHINDDSIWI